MNSFQPPAIDPTPPENPPAWTWVHRGAILATALTFIMIVVGALVTSQRAGDTDPTWSWRFWEWFQRWDPTSGGLAYEIGHRMVGTILGFVVIAMVIAAWRRGNRGLRWMSGFALAMVVAQGVLGGVRVLVVSHPGVQQAMIGVEAEVHHIERHRAFLAMGHGVIAQVTLCVMAAMALITSRSWIQAKAPPASRHSQGTLNLAMTATLVALVQLALGTYVRQTSESVLLHVIGALATTLLVLMFAMRIFRHHGEAVPLVRCARWMTYLVAIQIFLGVIPTLLTQGTMLEPMPISLVVVLRSAHVGNGALLLVTLAFSVFWCFRLLTQSEATESAPEPSSTPTPSRFSDYCTLSKMRIVVLVMLTSAVGFLVASLHMPRPDGTVDWGTLMLALLGIGIAAAGTSALNQVMEHRLDALMDRTRNRPLPAGRMSRASAMLFGLVLSCVGVGMLVLWVGWLAAALTAGVTLSYLLVYTPLKRMTTFSTLVGAVPGALPPVIGWAAATGEVGKEALTLWLIMFVWQLPHFWAIAWFYREDYRRAGMKMLSLVDESGGMMGRQIGLWSLALFLSGLLPISVGIADHAYIVVAFTVGGAFLLLALAHAFSGSQRLVRALYFASLVYLPSLFLTLVAAHW